MRVLAELKRSAVAIAPDRMLSGHGLGCVLVQVRAADQTTLCPPSKAHFQKPRAHGHGQMNFDSGELTHNRLRTSNNSWELQGCGLGYERGYTRLANQIPL